MSTVNRMNRYPDPQSINIPPDILQDPSSSKHLKKLGSGSFGTVYLYQNKELQYEVAIKVIDTPVDMSTKEISKEITNEIETHKSLEHPHIVRYLASTIQFNRLFIIIEFVEGGSLRDYLSETPTSETTPRSRLDDPTVLNYSVQILEGLVYLHSSNIIHRDLRTANVLRSVSDDLKIADFGISKKLDNLSTCAQATTKNVGNVYWRAPEVMESTGKPGRKVDVWSFGILMLEMIYVVPPFMTKMDAVQYLCHLMVNKAVPDVPQFLPRDMLFVLEQCLTFDCDKRLSSDELLDIVKSASAGTLSGLLSENHEEPVTIDNLATLEWKTYSKEKVLALRNNTNIREFHYVFIVYDWIKHHRPELEVVAELVNSMKPEQLSYEAACHTTFCLHHGHKYTNIAVHKKLPSYLYENQTWKVSRQDITNLLSDQVVTLSMRCSITNCVHFDSDNHHTVTIKLDTTVITVIPTDTEHHTHGNNENYVDWLLQGCNYFTGSRDVCAFFNKDRQEISQFIDGPQFSHVFIIVLYRDGDTNWTDRKTKGSFTVGPSTNTSTLQ